MSCYCRAGLESFVYAPDKEISGLKKGDLLLCEIDAEHLTTENIGIKERRVWGTDTYTDNSDLVAICAHAGVFNPTAELPKFGGIVVVVRAAEALDVYPASQHNNLRSRSLTGPEHTGLSLRVQGSAVYKSADERAKLTHVVQRPPRLERFSIKSHNAFSTARVVFNLSNEPAFKYCLSMVADRSPDAKHWTSVRLQSYSLYLETVGGRRFELSLESHVPGHSVTYRFAECLNPRTTSKAAIQVGLVCARAEPGHDYSRRNHALLRPPLLCVRTLTSRTPLPSGFCFRSSESRFRRQKPRSSKRGCLGTRLSVHPP